MIARLEQELNDRLQKQQLISDQQQKPTIGTDTELENYKSQLKDLQDQITKGLNDQITKELNDQKEQWIKNITTNVQGEVKPILIAALKNMQKNILSNLTKIIEEEVSKELNDRIVTISEFEKQIRENISGIVKSEILKLRTAIPEVKSDPEVQPQQNRGRHGGGKKDKDKKAHRT